MKTVASYEDVIQRPHPSLDETAEESKRFQFNAYQDALDLLLKSNKTVIHSIPAGAGSGKTRVLVAILNGLLRCGVPSDQIEAISFTNASANDFRRKHIQAALNIGVDIELEPENISFSTIHLCAMNVLKKLQPHMGGVAYYFEDAKTGNQDNDDEERRKAVRLALYSSVVYGAGDATLLETLAGYAEEDDKTFILEDLGVGDHLARAKKLIREDLVSDAGLGAFTNTGDGGPDYCIAVATDALMRLYHAEISVEEKRKIYGIPAFMAVDEAQDLDFLQLLFLRALAQNGVSIILVGDSRQTLYEFRKSLSDYPFLDGFMKDFVEGTGIHASISDHALCTNYRCRREIIDGAEEVSLMAVEYSVVRHQKGTKPANLEKIEDPEHIAEGIAYITPDNEKEKLAAAITVIVGEPAEINEQRPMQLPNSPGGALGLLPEFAASSEKNEAKLSQRKSRSTQIVAMSGGENSGLIKKHLAMLYERAKKGETAAIITRNGIRDIDNRFLKEVIYKAHSSAKDDLKLNLISPPKYTPLGEYWYPDTEGKPTHELPFSSVLIAAAMSYVLSSDREIQQRLKIEGRREIVTVFVRPNGIKEIEQKSEYIQTIAEELRMFFKGFSSKCDDLFPLADTEKLAAQIDELRLMAAKFTFEVLSQYGRLIWQMSPIPSPHPCRFHYMASEYVKGRNEGMAIKQLHETKRYLKLMWRALASTVFQLTEGDRSKLRLAELTPEKMDANTSLGNFAQSVNDYCCVRSTTIPELGDLRQTFIKDRETIYDEFSQLWHVKTRTYMREIARGLGKHVRNNPGSSEEALRAAVWKEEYLNAKYKARLNITYKPDKNQYGGLFVDFVSGIKHDIVIQRRGGKSKSNVNDVVVDLTTIHSSKGLEWDHVVLYFPQPSANDKDSSFKACRDLIYVAMTRAARTLTIILQKRKKLVETPTDTGVKIFVELMHRWATEKNYYNRSLNWGVTGQHQEESGVVVYDETSHSELERSQTCRMHHYYQDIRRVSTMVPLTPPSYAFFFHGTMSTICAAFIGQRLPSRADPSMEIAGAVAQIVETNANEKDAFNFLTNQVSTQLFTLMESMIPMYFLGDRLRHQALLNYYTDSITRHLAAIASGSKLFRMLKEYRAKPAYRILIEKSVRKVLESDDAQAILPIMGIPDIKIVGPDITYVADYKTVPRYDESQDNEDQLVAYERMLSTKTQQQVNYYQGMIQAGANHRYLAELLYVADITLMEHEDPPSVCDMLPHINQGSNYKIVAGVNHARVLYTDSFDREQFTDTVSQIRDLRMVYRDSSVRPEDMFQPVPLVGGGMGEVTRDQCMQCGSGVHCAFNKYLHVVEA